jgi:hypothetical protein
MEKDVIKINLAIEDYYVDKFDKFPLEKHKRSGIYFVFTSGFSKEVIGIKIIKLIYVGESENVFSRFKNGHEKYSEWNKQLEKDELLCYAFSAVKPKLRKRVEAALIYKCKPCCNDKNKETFGYQEDTTINLSDNKQMFPEIPDINFCY